MKVVFDVAKLKLRGPIHISRGRVDPESSGEIIHSDSLKSALFIAGLQLYGNQWEDHMEFWNSFQISSAYPFFQEELFFPKPMTKLNISLENEEEAAKLTKKLKKLTYLGKTYFEEVLAGNPSHIPADHMLSKGTFVSSVIGSGSLLQSGKEQVIIGRDLQQRVRIPKMWEEISNETQNTFYIERIYFHPKGGLFTLFYGMSEDTKKRLKAMLRLLGEYGLGKNRTFGFGQFDFEDFESLELTVPENAEHWTNLSLYCPTGDHNNDAEITPSILNQSAYSLIKRGGWISSPQNHEHLTHRKKSIYMFNEGSVFHFGPSNLGAQVKGKMVNLQPDIVKEHPIWRDGRGIFVPLANQLN